MLDIQNGSQTQRRLADVVARVAFQHDICRDIEATDSLVDIGMTSMAMVDLMLTVEAEFDVLIPQRDMTPANFQSIVTLAKLLDRLN